MEKDLIKQLHSEWRGLVQAIGAKMKPVLQAHDLTKVDGIVMMTVRKKSARTKAELAQRLHFEPASLTRSLNRLVQRGLIHRYADPADKRFIRLALTVTGEKLTQTLEKNMLAFWKTAFRGASAKDLRFFTTLLTNAKQNLLSNP